LRRHDVSAGDIDRDNTSTIQKPRNALAVIPGGRRKRMQSEYIIGRPIQPVRLGRPLVGDEDERGIDNSLPSNRVEVARRVGAKQSGKWLGP
jgi:hypothetical protein